MKNYLLLYLKDISCKLNWNTKLKFILGWNVLAEIHAMPLWAGFNKPACDRQVPIGPTYKSNRYKA